MIVLSPYIPSLPSALVRSWTVAGPDGYQSIGVVPGARGFRLISTIGSHRFHGFQFGSGSMQRVFTSRRRARRRWKSSTNEIKHPFRHQIKFEVVHDRIILAMDGANAMARSTRKGALLLAFAKCLL